MFHRRLILSVGSATFTTSACLRRSVPFSLPSPSSSPLRSFSNKNGNWNTNKQYNNQGQANGFNLDDIREKLQQSLGDKTLDDVLEERTKSSGGFFSSLRAKIPARYTPIGLIVRVEELDMIDVIRDPINEQEIKNLFNKYNNDKDAGLNRQEWEEFGKILFRADISIIVEEVRDQISDLVSSKAPPMAEILEFLGAPKFSKKVDQFDFGFSEIYELFKDIVPVAVTMLAKKVEPSNQQEWIQSMFEAADKNRDGMVSLNEFVSFLENESRIEAQTLRILILGEVATNLEENHGSLRIVTKHNNNSSSISTPLFGITPEDIRNLK